MRSISEIADDRSLTNKERACQALRETAGAESPGSPWTIFYAVSALTFATLANVEAIQEADDAYRTVNYAFKSDFARESS